jgi:hypothetical protein
VSRRTGLSLLSLPYSLDLALSQPRKPLVEATSSVQLSFGELFQPMLREAYGLLVGSLLLLSPTQILVLF